MEIVQAKLVLAMPPQQQHELKPSCTHALSPNYQWKSCKRNSCSRCRHNNSTSSSLRARMHCHAGLATRRQTEESTWPPWLSCLLWAFLSPLGLRNGDRSAPFPLRLRRPSVGESAPFPLGLRPSVSKSAPCLARSSKTQKTPNKIQHQPAAILDVANLVRVTPTSSVPSLEAALQAVLPAAHKAAPIAAAAALVTAGPGRAR